jgi:hypothetical protein
MTEPKRRAAELGEKEAELERLMDEHLARFLTDAALTGLDIDEAIAALREALRTGRPVPPPPRRRG